MNTQVLQRLKNYSIGRQRDDSGSRNGDSYSVLSKKNLKALSLTGGDLGDKLAYVGNRDDDTLSQRSNSTRVSVSLTQTLQNPAVSLDPHRNMQNFLANVSPEVRRAIQQITGTTAL